MQSHDYESVNLNDNDTIQPNNQIDIEKLTKENTLHNEYDNMLTPQEWQELGRLKQMNAERKLRQIGQSSQMDQIYHSDEGTLQQLKANPLFSFTRDK